MVLKTNLALKSNYGSYRSPNKIKYIVLHYTANDGDTDESNAKYFKSYRGVSAHYFVDDDSVTMSVPDTYAAHSVGGKRYSNYKSTGGAKFYKICTNSNSISIELTDTNRDGKIMASEKTIANAIELTVILMRKYNIPPTNIIRHFDVTGKSCPAYFVNDNKWNQIKDRISANMQSNMVDYSLVFNADYYSNKYADLKKEYGTDTTKLLNHFLTYGMNEKRQAIGTFNVNVYMQYPDLKASYGNDYKKYYMHYITNGHTENRKAI